MSNLPIEEDVKVGTNDDLKLSIQKRDVVVLLLAYNAAFIVSWILGKNDLFNCFVVSCFIALLVPFIIVANKMFQKVYIEEELKLQERYFNDLLHIAVATFHNMDVIVSWNLQHIVKLKTILAVEKVNKRFKYKSIHICTPEEI